MADFYENAETDVLQEAIVEVEAFVSEARRKAFARAEDLAKAEEETAKAAVIFLGALVFCAGAIGGFVVVGQMLTDYGSCVLFS
jgi:hypothetical protein